MTTTQDTETRGTAFERSFIAMLDQIAAEAQPRKPKTRKPKRATTARPAETEAQFQAAVMELAQRLGWMCYHVPDSRRTTSPGFPDLVLVRGGRLLFVELKTARGRVRPEQMVWLSALCSAGVRAFVARPRDWALIEAELMDKAV